MPNGIEKHKKRLVIHSHLKGEPDDNGIHVYIEHANKMSIVSPLKRQ